MTRHQSTPDAAVLVAIDIAKRRNEVLIQIPGHARQQRPVARSASLSRYVGRCR